jgi:Flp pilus assembly protein TadG
MKTMLSIIPPSTGSLSARRRRGVAIIYIVVMMIVLLGFCSLAVDLGHVQACKTELENAIDAAARAAAANVAGGVTAVQTAAAAMAANNTCDGTPVTINSVNNVVFLNWPSTTPLTGSARSSANAIQVNASYPVALMFAQAFGFPTCVVHAKSTAEAVTSAPNYQILSLGQFDFNGGKTDSWNSASGNYSSGVAANQGSIAADGYITFNSPSVCNGNIYYYGTMDNNGGTCTGSEIHLASALTAATPTTPGGATSLGYITVNDGTTTTLTAGTYSCTGVLINATGTLAINAAGGVVNLYVTGYFSSNGGSVTVTGNKAANFHLYITNASGIQLDSPCSMYAVIDMPLASLNLNTGTTVYGSVVADYIELDTGSYIHFDQALGTNGGTGSGTTISQVQ